MADTLSPLDREIRRLIVAAGPMPVADYMRLCLTHPQYGYYINRDPFGRSGDFVTAPEISQMFGELIGLWMASVWQQMGSPENVRIVELGPGRGTLMKDAMRAVRVVKDFRAAVVLHFVEISSALQRMQEQEFAELGIPAFWHGTFEDVPAGPIIVIANEFVDALPVHQAVKQTHGWHERVVELTASGKLQFGLARETLLNFETGLPRALRRSAEGSVFEWRSDRLALELGRRVRADGAALIIDYGHSRVGFGDTLQAVAGHAFTDPLQTPGEADLTAHVDFEAFAQIAESIGTRIHGPVQQRDFLLALGIDKRAATLKAGLPRDKALEIDMALSRLTEPGAKGMGELFKALAITDPKLVSVPGFEAAR
jgi:NADH dehydrogenase [ubiquinone] 1 alpha subcomplex assembly factor 7